MKTLKQRYQEFKHTYLWADKDMLVAFIAGIAIGAVVVFAFSTPQVITNCWRPLVG